MDEERKKVCTEGCSRLRFTVVPANRPPAIDAGFWAQAVATGELCGEGSRGHIRVSAEGLIPLGVYTLWFLTNRGYIPAAPVEAVYTADGADPNRLTVNSRGILNYYVAPLDFNPFRGIPVPGGMATIQDVAITLNTDRTTYGTSPGTPGVNSFVQLLAPICYPRSE